VVSFENHERLPHWWAVGRQNVLGWKVEGGMTRRREMGD
jgi:hypothetical protein